MKDIIRKGARGGGITDGGVVLLKKSAQEVNTMNRYGTVKLI